MGPAKHAKRRERVRGVGREADFTSRDPTLNVVGTRSCAIRRGISKKRATAIFDLSLRVGHPSEFGHRRNGRDFEQKVAKEAKRDQELGFQPDYSVDSL